MRADAVIGFGHFDLRIPDFCGKLIEEGRAERLIFTGGIGAGTLHLNEPEADAFARRFGLNFPALAERLILAENRSTNTAENIDFTMKALKSRGPDFALGQGIRSAILIAHPARLRRVRQTWRLKVPCVPAVALAPSRDFGAETALYASHGLSLPGQLLGEMQRLRDYPGRGWIEAAVIPPEVTRAEEALRGRAAPEATQGWPR